MAKTIDVTMTTMKSTGQFNASPVGVIRCVTINALDDEDVRQAKALYLRLSPDRPMHPGGAFSLAPGQTLTYDVTERLTVNQGESLMFSRDLAEGDVERYQGSFNRTVKFDAIDGFDTVDCGYGVIEGGEFIKAIKVNFTVKLISG